MNGPTHPLRKYIKIIVANNQEYKRKYWFTRSLAPLTHLLAALICSLARSLTPELVGKRFFVFNMNAPILYGFNPLSCVLAPDFSAFAAAHGCPLAAAGSGAGGSPQ